MKRWFRIRSKEENEICLAMAGNLNPADVSKILILALKIKESGNNWNDTSKLIRAIEMS